MPDGALPAALTDRMAAVRRTGTTLKVNLALSGLPRFTCLPEDAPSPFGATIHLLPGSADLGAFESPMAALRAMWADVQAGRLPAEPTIEWYVHTTVDASLQDDAGHHSSALFVQSVPVRAGRLDRGRPSCPATWRGCWRSATGTRPAPSELVVDTLPLTPPGIEAHFGITGGHIHHVDNTVAFTDRMPYATGLDGLYAGSAGTHPAGSVIGAAGHNAARRILPDLAADTSPTGVAVALTAAFRPFVPTTTPRSAEEWARGSGGRPTPFGGRGCCGRRWSGSGRWAGRTSSRAAGRSASLPSTMPNRVRSAFRCGHRRCTDPVAQLDVLRLDGFCSSYQPSAYCSRSSERHLKNA